MKQNMKRVLLVLCMAVCLLVLSACSGSGEENSGVDPAQADMLKQQTVGLLEVIAGIPVEEMGTVIQENRSVGAEALAAGLENYLSVVPELGGFVSADDGDVEAVHGGYKIAVNTVFDKRPVIFEVVVDEGMMNITSLSFNPIYSTAERMEKAGLNTLMGMGTVFCVLIFISFLISGFKYINAWEANRKNKITCKELPEEALPVASVSENQVDDLELVAVITAAIAASENTSADGLIVRSIRRVSAGTWKRSN